MKPKLNLNFNLKKWGYGLAALPVILGLGLIFWISQSSSSEQVNPLTMPVMPRAGLRDNSIIENVKTGSLPLTASPVGAGASPSTGGPVSTHAGAIPVGLGAEPPVFEETASLIRLKTARMQVEIEKEVWRMSVSGPFGPPVWRQAEPDEKAGLGVKTPYGSPAFLVDKTQLRSSQAALYPSKEPREWFHLGTVTAVHWNYPLLRLDTTTDDPAGRRAIVTLKLDPAGALFLNLELSSSEGVVSVAVSGQAPTGEHFYGLGQRQVSVDQRGRKMFNLVRGRYTLNEGKGEGSYAPYPFYLSSRGYGLLAYSMWPSSFDMAAKRSDASLITVEAANLNLVFFVDQDPLNILQNLSAVAGHPPLPPKWTFGVWKTSIGGQAAVLAEARRLRAEQIPVSALFIYDIIDSPSGTGWDTQIFKPIPPGTYPDIAAFNQELHKANFKTLAYTDDGVLEGLPLFEEGLQRGYFITNQKGRPYNQPMSNKAGALIDFTNSAAVKWYQQGLKRLLVDLGFDGGMQDQGDLLPRDAVLSNGSTGYEAANTYNYLYARAAYEASQQFKPESVFFMRSGYLGSQQFQNAVWTGDLDSSWDARKGLPSAVTAALTRSIAGSPFIGTEIAGYHYVDLPFSERRELYLRWTQFSAFTPIMRDTLGPQPLDAVYLWTDAQTIANFKKYSRLHTDLFPLMYSLAKEASQTGWPIMRHPYLLYPNDPRAAAQEYEYFLGDNLLVAPVVNFKEAEKMVYIPQGEWVDFWSRAVYTGEQELKVKAELDIIPLFVKAGAIVPTLLNSPASLAGPLDPMTSGLRLTVYGGSAISQNSKLTLYDGTGLAYTKSGRRVKFNVEGSGSSRLYQLELPAAGVPVGVRLEGSAVFEQAQDPASRQEGPGWHYDAVKQQVVVRLTGQEFELTLEF